MSLEFHLVRHASEAALRREQWLSHLDGPLGVVLSLVLVAAIWEFTSTFIVNPKIIPPPSGVIRASIPMFALGEIVQSLAISLVRVLVGFGLGSAAGIVVGIVMGRVRILNSLLDPALELMRYRRQPP